jgi:hypothetical protein
MDDLLAPAPRRRRRSVQEGHLEDLHVVQGTAGLEQQGALGF